MLRIQHVSKVYRDKKNEVIALNDISLTLPNKGMVFVIGKSGSGKSTLLNMIAGFSTPSSGDIIFNGNNICKMNGKELNLYHEKRLSFIFQNYCILENLSVKENIALGRKEKAKHLEKEINEVLKEISLSAYKDKKAGLLSGGEKQRVAIGRALIKSPELVLCDEPTGNLDKNSSKDVLKLLKEISKRTLVVIVSHNLFDTYEYGDRIITLENGMVKEDKSHQEENEPGTVVLNGEDFLNTTFIEELNEKIKNKEIKKIISSKDTFVSTKPKAYEKQEQRKETLSHSIGYFRSLFHSFSIHRLKAIFFCLLSSLLIVLSLLTNNLYNIGKYSLVKDSDYFINNNMTVYQKFTAPEGEYRLQKLRVTEEDEKAIEEIAPKKEYHSFYRFYPATTAYSFSQNNSSSYMTRESYDRSTYANGILISDEAFMKRVLRISTIDYVAKAEEIKKSGVYLTDYYADSMISKSRGFYKSYNDLTGFIPCVSWTRNNVPPDFYVNGIIKTDYKTKYQDFLSVLEQSKERLDSRFYEKANMEAADYFYNSLRMIYTTNENFFDDLMEERTKKVTTFYAYLSIPGSSLYTGKVNILVSYSPNLKDNEIGLSDTRFNALKGDSDFKEEDVSESSPLILGFQKQNEQVYDNISPSYKFNKMYQYSKHQDLFPGVSSVPSAYVSENVFNQILKDNYFKEGIYLDGKPENKIIQSFTERKFRPMSALASISNNFYDNFSPFKTLFLLFSVFCFLVSLLILYFYASTTLHSHRYEIGVYRSLGYSDLSLSTGFFCHFLLFTFLTTFLTLFAYQGGYRITNRILLKILQRFVMNGGTIAINFLSFEPKIFFLFFCFTLFFTTLLGLIYFLILKKAKVDEILRNGD